MALKKVRSLLRRSATITKRDNLKIDLSTGEIVGLGILLLVVLGLLYWFYKYRSTRWKKKLRREKYASLTMMQRSDLSQGTLLTKPPPAMVRSQSQGAVQEQRQQPMVRSQSQGFHQEQLRGQSPSRRPRQSRGSGQQNPSQPEVSAEDTGHDEPHAVPMGPGNPESASKYEPYISQPIVSGFRPTEPTTQPTMQPKVPQLQPEEPTIHPNQPHIKQGRPVVLKRTLRSSRANRS